MYSSFQATEDNCPSSGVSVEMEVRNWELDSHNIHLVHFLLKQIPIVYFSVSVNKTYTRNTCHICVSSDLAQIIFYFPRSTDHYIHGELIADGSNLMYSVSVSGFVHHISTGVVIDFGRSLNF